MVIINGLDICEIGTLEDIMEIGTLADISDMHFEITSDDFLPVLWLEVCFIKRMSLTYIFTGIVQGQKAWELKSYIVSGNPVGAEGDMRKFRYMINAIDAFVDSWSSNDTK